MQCLEFCKLVHKYHHGVTGNCYIYHIELKLLDSCHMEARIIFMLIPKKILNFTFTPNADKVCTLLEILPYIWHFYIFDTLASVAIKSGKSGGFWKIREFYFIQGKSVENDRFFRESGKIREPLSF